jgi:hypothetical protein
MAFRTPSQGETDQALQCVNDRWLPWGAPTAATLACLAVRRIGDQRRVLTAAVAFAGHIRVAGLIRPRHSRPFDSRGRRMQVWVFLLQLPFVRPLGLLLRPVCPDVVTTAVSAGVGAPGVRLGVVPDALRATLAVAAGAVVLAGFCDGDDCQVGSTTIQTVMVSEDHFMTRRDGAYHFPVKVLRLGLLSFLPVPDRIALLAVALAAVEPPEALEPLEILVIDDRDLVLGEGNGLHGEHPCCCVAVMASGGFPAPECCREGGC